MNDERPTHLDLFSGIGGFALAAKWAGFKTIAFCEQDPYAKRVLAKNFPGVPTFDDVFDLDGKQFRGTDVLSGGFPCQPYSHAGKRRGSEDDRAIWPQMARVISEARPKWVLGENVVGLVSMGLDQVFSDLEGLDYSCEAIVVPACAVDAHHRRDRVWILASCNDADTKRERLYREEIDKHGKTKPTHGEERDIGSVREVLAGRGDAEIGSSEDVGNANDSRVGASTSKPFPHGEETVERRKEQSQFEPCGSSAGFGRFWEIESDVGRVAHGIPDRMDRLKGLGNAIVPQVAFEFFRVMKGVK